MQLRAVSNIEADQARGLGPEYPSPPTTKEELLQPFSMRERLLVVAIGDALNTIVEDTHFVHDPAETCLVVWRSLLAAYGSATGYQWQAVPWR